MGRHILRISTGRLITMWTSDIFQAEVSLYFLVCCEVFPVILSHLLVTNFKYTFFPKKVWWRFCACIPSLKCTVGDVNVISKTSQQYGISPPCICAVCMLFRRIFFCDDIIYIDLQYTLGVVCEHATKPLATFFWNSCKAYLSFRTLDDNRLRTISTAWAANIPSMIALWV